MVDLRVPLLCGQEQMYMETARYIKKSILAESCEQKTR